MNTLKSKFYTLFLCLFLLIFLSACGKSREVREAEAAIGGIGVVSLDSEATIRNARLLYDGLSERDQAKVENYAALNEAESTFHELVLQDAASTVVTLIDGLGSSYPSNKDRIVYARKQYELLASDEQAYVSNYQALVEAEEALHAFFSEQAQLAINKIDALGTITEQSKDSLLNARYFYNGLSDESKELVTNLDKLEAAEAVYIACISEIGLNEMQAMLDSKQYDDAIAFCDRYIKDNPKITNQIELRMLASQAMLLLAQNYYQQKDYWNTRLTIDRAINDTNYRDIRSDMELLQEQLNETLIKNEPNNGKVFDSSAQGGYGQLKIESGASPLFIKVENTEDPSKCVSFYVRADSTATVNVRDGTYTVKYASGKQWYGEEHYFGSGTYYKKADDILEFSTRYTGDYVEYNVVTLTLYAVWNGNMSSSVISEDEF